MQDNFQFNFVSDFTEARAAQEKIIQAVERHGYDADAILSIKLALEEATINAIKHGNRFDKGKTVRIDATISDERVEIFIEDQGPGFIRCSVPDPRADENLQRLHGRGLLLMEAYMNEVEYSNEGRRIRLLYLKNSPPQRHCKEDKP